MAFIKADRVQETSVTTGSGNIVLAGAYDATYRTFASQMANGDTCQILTISTTAAEWEIDEATYDSATNSLARTTLLSSSTGSTVVFSSGAKRVAMLPPASASVVEDNQGTAAITNDLTVGNSVYAATDVNIGRNSVFSGSTSGTTTLKASAGASGTLTLPAATDTLVGKATTDTLTNKSMSGLSNTFTNLPASSITGTLGTTNGGTGSATIAGASVNLSNAFVVATLAALKALTERPPLVSTLGYSSANDGGGGLWMWVAGSTTTPNDGTVVQCSSGAAGRYFRMYETEKNVKWWGATGNGTTDDRLSILAALNDGGTIFFPSGTYKISATINTTSSKLTIKGNGAATIKMAVGMTSNGIVVNADYFTCTGMIFDASEGLAYTGTSNYFAASLFVSGSYYHVSECRFVGGTYNPRLPGTYPAPYYGIYVGGYSDYAMNTDGFISSIDFYGGVNGLLISGGRRIDVSGIVAVGCASFGAVVGNGLSVQEISVSQFTAISCGLYGFSNSAQFGGAGVDPQPMTNWNLTNMQASYCGWRSFFDGGYGAIGAGKYGYDITDGGLNNFHMQAIAKDCCVGAMESKAGYFPGYDTTLLTSASTASGSVLPFASTSGVYVGMTVSGTNIAADTHVSSKTSTSVTLTRAITGVVASGASIAFTVGITPSGHKNVSVDVHYTTSVASPNVSGTAVWYGLEDSVSDQYFGEKQYAKVFATTKQATSFRSGLYQNPYQVMASDGSLWICFGAVATGAGGYTGQTAPTGGKYVKSPTNAATASGTVLSFASVTDIAAGQAVFGVNIVDGTTVASVDAMGNTVTLSQAVAGSGVSNGANIIFGTLANDGNLYWLCLGTDYSGGVLNNNIAFQVNCVSYIYADVVSIGNGYGVLFTTQRGVANAIDNVTVTARVIGARYGVQCSGTGGTLTNAKLLACDISAEVGVLMYTGTNNLEIVGGKITSTANSAALSLQTGTNNVTISGDAYLYATTGRSIYGYSGTNTISITSATFDGGVNGSCPCDFSSGTYTITWGNATIINRNGSNQQSGYRNTGTAVLTTYGGPFRRDLTTAPSGTTKGNIGEHMVLAAPTATVWGYVCTAADFVTPAFTWKAKVLA